MPITEHYFKYFSYGNLPRMQFQWKLSNFQLQRKIDFELSEFKCKSIKY